MSICPKCRLPTELTCPNRECPIKANWASIPFLLSDTFLIRATCVMTAFNFSIMLIFFLAGLFGGT